jgi:hypothetical protein
MDDISGGIIETVGHNKDGSVKYQAAPRPEVDEKRIKW